MFVIIINNICLTPPSWQFSAPLQRSPAPPAAPKPIPKPTMKTIATQTPRNTHTTVFPGSFCPTWEIHYVLFLFVFPTCVEMSSKSSFIRWKETMVLLSKFFFTFTFTFTPLSTSLIQSCSAKKKPRFS